MATISVRREGATSIDDVKWGAEELEFVEKPNGPAAAVVIGGGLGVFFLGLFTTLNEASTGIHDWLTFDKGVGPLSGKTVMAVVFWLAASLILAIPLWKRNLSYGVIIGATVVLVSLGFIGTFPKFFQLFAN